MKKHTKQMVSQTSTNLMMDLIARIDQKYWKLYGYLMAVGILCHGFMLFNKIPNHDDVAAIFTKGTTYPLGRWFLNFTSVIAGGFSIPLFIGLFSLTMIIGSAFLVCKVLDIEDTGRIFAVGAVMVCFPAVAGTFAFMFTADSYFLALFLACAGVWFTVKLTIKMKKRGGVNYVLAVILLALTLGLYQAYFSVAVTLSVAYGMLLFLRESLERFIKQFLTIILVLVLGMLLYLVINHFVLIAAKSSFQGTSMKEVIDTIPHAIRMSYQNLFSLFYKDLAGLSYGKIMQLSWVLSVAAISWIWVWISVKKRKQMLFAAGLLLCIPVSINFMRFFMNNREMDALIMYAYVLVFVMAIAFLGAYETWSGHECFYCFKLKLLRTMYVLVIASIVWQYTIQINRFYVGMDLIKSEAVSYYTTMITQIKSVEGYQSDLPVCLIGTRSQDQSLTTFDPFTADVRGRLSLYSFAGMYSRQRFMSMYCGYAPVWHQNIDEVNGLPQVQEMPCYPDDGSIRILNDMIVIKLESIPVP